MLTNPNIKDEIRKRLDNNGFTDENTDAQHLFLLNQFEDLSVKAKMIEHYNKLKGRLVDRMEVKTDLATAFWNKKLDTPDK